MKTAEIIFEVTEAADGGYDARALGHAIFTQGEDWADLKAMVRDAVRCHMTLTTMIEGSPQSVTVPRHRHLSVGTLSAIMAAVAEATGESKRDVRKRLFGG